MIYGTSVVKRKCTKQKNRNQKEPSPNMVTEHKKRQNKRNQEASPETETKVPGFVQ